MANRWVYFRTKTRCSSCWPAPNPGLLPPPNADQLPRRKIQVCRKGACRRPGKSEKAKNLIGLQETEEGKTWPMGGEKWSV